MSHESDPHFLEHADDCDVDYSRPFRIRVIEDCRDETTQAITGSFTGQIGWCLGMYEYPDVNKKRPSDEKRDIVFLPRKEDKEEEFILYNPLLHLDSGNYLWGIDCWFAPNDNMLRDIPLDIMQEAFKKYIQLPDL